MGFRVQGFRGFRFRVGRVARVGIMYEIYSHTDQHMEYEIETVVA